MSNCLIPDIWSDLFLLYCAFNIGNRKYVWYRLTTTFRMQVWRILGMLVLNELAMMERNVASSLFY